MFNLALDICKNSSVLRTLGIVRILINIIKILVPLLIIIISTIDIAKDALGTNPEKIGGQGSKLLSRIFIGLIIFITPTVFVNILNLFVDYKDVENNFIDCQACLANKGDCETAIQIAQYLEDQDKIDLNEMQSVSGRFVFEQQSSNPNNTSPETSDAEVVGGGKYFDRNDVTKISGLTAEELKQKLKNCPKYRGKAKRYLPYAEDLIAAEKRNGINVFYMIGVYSLESGWAGSELARECNNLGGIKYGSKQRYFGKPTTKCWQQSTGAWFAGFENVGGFIEYHTQLLKNKYVTPGAPYYHGKTPEAIAQVYGHKNSVNTIIEIATNIANS